MSELGRRGLLLLLAAVVLVAAGAMLLRGGSDEGAPAVIVSAVTPTPRAAPTAAGAPAPTATPEPEPTATATPRAPATATEGPAPEPTATPEPEPTATATATPEPGAVVVETIEELHAEYGEPPGAVLGRLRVPALGVDAPLGQTRVGSNGVMPNPAGPSDVLWYDFSEWEGIGGAIGGGGNAVFSAHVDYAARVQYAGVDYRGRGVFFGLSLLSPGDMIEVETGGRILRYAVSWRDTVNAEDTDWNEVLSSDVAVDSITLITCGGEFDFDSRSYVDRVVVRAERI